MNYVAHWETKKILISELEVGSIFRRFSDLNSEPYLFVGLWTSVLPVECIPVFKTWSLPYIALDILQMENLPQLDSKRYFPNMFVCKGILTKEGTAFVAGLIASGV